MYRYLRVSMRLTLRRESCSALPFIHAGKFFLFLEDAFFPRAGAPQFIPFPPPASFGRRSLELGGFVTEPFDKPTLFVRTDLRSNGHASSYSCRKCSGIRVLSTGTALWVLSYADMPFENNERKRQKKKQNI